MKWERFKKKVVEIAGTPALFIIAFIAMLLLFFVPFILRFFK